MKDTKKRAAATPQKMAGPPETILPLERSVGYQVRMSHRALQRYLQLQIEPHGVTLGMWYFLRALWHEDGLTQSELSQRVGTMEPTTLSAIAAMEKAGLVTRLRNIDDRRKINVSLTDKAKKLRPRLLPLAAGVVGKATEGMTAKEVETLLDLLGRVQANFE